MSLLSTCRSTAPAPARMMTSAVPFLILFLVGVSFAERYWVNFGARRRATEYTSEALKKIRVRPVEPGEEAR